MKIITKKNVASIVKYILIYMITRIFVLVIENIFKTSSDVLKKISSYNDILEKMFIMAAGAVMIVIIIISWYRLMNLINIPKK